MTSGLKRFRLCRRHYFDDYIMGIEVDGAKATHSSWWPRSVVDDILGDIPLVVIVDGKNGAVSSD